MALTLPQALQRLSNPIMQGIAKTVVTTDQMASVLPIVPVAGHSYTFVREGAEPVGGAFIDDSGVTSEESTGLDDRTSIEFRRLVGNMDVDEFANSLSSGEAASAQMAKKVKATWRKVSAAIINGNRTTGHVLSPSAAPFTAITAATYSPWLDSGRRGPGSVKYTHVGTLWQFRAPGDPDYGPAVTAAANGSYTLYSYNKSKWIRVTLTVASATANGTAHIEFSSSTHEFDGLNQIIDPSMTIDPTGVNGDAYSYAKLDRMLSTVKVRENLAFVMNSSLVEKHYALARALGGTTPEFCEIPGVMGMAKVPSYRGVPILVNDWVGSAETIGGTTNASSIYLASMSAAEGLFLAGCSFGGQSIQGESDPRNVPVLGFRITDVGMLEGKDARRTRIAFYGALGLKSLLAAARSRGIQTA